ncbi:MAG: winged helix-turn-helix transcriptional regulator [Aureispira sp.]
MRKEKMINLEDNKCERIDCPVITTLGVIGGKWKPAILWTLKQWEVARFNNLRRSLAPITQKMLTQQLRELEANGIINRKVYAEVPPRVEYRLTPYGETLMPIMDEMAKWGAGHQQSL